MFVVCTSLVYHQQVLVPALHFDVVIDLVEVLCRQCDPPEVRLLWCRSQ